MALLELNDVLRVNIVCNTGPQYSQNVVNFLVKAVANSFTDQDAVDTLSVLFGDALVPILSDQASYKGCRLVRVLGVATQPVISTNGNAQGDVIGDILPPQTACVIKKVTTQGGRRGRGRFFVPFPSEASMSSDGTSTPAYRTALSTLQTLLSTDQAVNVGARTATLRAVLFKSGEGIGSVFQVTSTLIRTPFGTQRRRSLINRGDENPIG